MALACALVTLPRPAAQAQSTPGQPEGPLTEHPGQSQGQGRSTPANSAPPRSDTGAPAPNANESSSERTRIDLSPPKADERAHPDGGHAADDALGTHEWNPLRAMKDVEVGTFYYNDHNYKAAISRFREALEFKPRDAVATFKLAQALEKSKDFDGARTEYEAYLTILKDGPSADAARKALARLKKR